MEIEPFKWSTEKHIPYLGIQIPASSKFTLAYCNPPIENIMEHIETVLHPRNSRENVIFGRILNIKAFVASKLNYYFALGLSPPQNILQNAQLILNNYVWAYGINNNNNNNLFKSSCVIHLVVNII